MAQYTFFGLNRSMSQFSRNVKLLVEFSSLTFIFRVNPSIYIPFDTDSINKNTQTEWKKTEYPDNFINVTERDKFKQWITGFERFVFDHSQNKTN